MTRALITVVLIERAGFLASLEGLRGEAAEGSGRLVFLGAFGVHYPRYWVDQEHGKIFCLVDAPDADAAATVHRAAHGLVADEIYPVAEGA